MLAFINVFAVKSIWRIRLNEKIFDFRVLALNITCYYLWCLACLPFFFSEELLTVRLLFISYHSIWSFQGTCSLVVLCTANTVVYQPIETKMIFDLKSLVKFLFFKIRHPPAFPCRLQHSIIGRLGLNHRVRDVDGCFPQTHRHRKFSYSLFMNTGN